MLEFFQYFTRPKACQYLPEQTARLHYRVILALSPEEYEALLEQGWRRMGIHFFRPACPACVQCRSLRVPVPEFAPSRSQRRIEKVNRALRVVVQSPTVSAEHVRLWNGYHQFMHEHRGWPENPIDAAEYAESFLSGNFSFSREFLYYDGPNLVAVGLVDRTPHALSSIYFFHDPAWRRRALGVYSMLAELRHAREAGLSHAYLGFWIEQCASMAYKADYRPHELLGTQRSGEAQLQEAEGQSGGARGLGWERKLHAKERRTRNINGLA